MIPSRTKAQGRRHRATRRGVNTNEQENRGGRYERKSYAGVTEAPDEEAIEAGRLRTVAQRLCLTTDETQAPASMEADMARTRG